MRKLLCVLSLVLLTSCAQQTGQGLIFRLNGRGVFGKYPTLFFKIKNPVDKTVYGKIVCNRLGPYNQLLVDEGRARITGDVVIGPLSERTQSLMVMGNGKYECFLQVKRNEQPK